MFRTQNSKSRSDKKNRRGERFGRLVVIDEADSRNGDTRWKVRCNCGVEKEVSTSSLVAGVTLSCGCLQRETARRRWTIHGNSSKREYPIWRQMIRRCSDERDDSYHRYGGRGITVCDRWLNSFDAFYEDMGERPDGTSIDRIDNEGNYEPGNCRWATTVEQNYNKSTNRIVEHDGRRMAVTEWATELALPTSTLINRLNAWPVEKALSTPKRDTIVEYQGRRQRISHWAKELGISRDILSWRLQNWPLDDAFTTPIGTRTSRMNPVRKPITFNGKTQGVNAWAAELGIQRTTLSQRLRTMSVEDAFTRKLYQTPKTIHRKPKRLIEHNGKQLGITTWARELGVPKSTLARRIAKVGVEEAFAQLSPN